MIRLLIRTFIKDYSNTQDRTVRESYGVLSGVLGIVCNLSLFAVKLAVGLAINSIAVISDAFNNLTDSGSSIITVIGAKMSNRPPDNEHPYGHGRIEYISSLAISFIILAVGLQLLRSSVDKILNPEEVLFSPVSLLILGLSVLVKLWMVSYNRYIDRAINSSINRATAYDSLTDSVATSAAIASAVAANFTDVPVDGIAGIAISLYISYAGFTIAKDTVDLLLGSPPTPELIEAINAMVAEGRHIVATHDLIVHDYGPGRVVASVHAEVPDDVSIVEVHSEIDALEKRIGAELGIDIVIHMDPSSAVRQGSR